MSDRSLNRYAEFLGAAGAQVGEVDQVWWFKYNGFLRPAYLPHEIPAISPNTAREARRQLGGGSRGGTVASALYLTRNGGTLSARALTQWTS